MAATKPIPVRLDQNTIKRLDGAAKRLGSNRAALIKFCAKTFVDHFERHGGIASLPPDWRELLREQNSRTRESRLVRVPPTKNKPPDPADERRRNHSAKRTRGKAGRREDDRQ
jgi:hypothetical protein